GRGPGEWPCRRGAVGAGPELVDDDPLRALADPLQAEHARQGAHHPGPLHRPGRPDDPVPPRQGPGGSAPGADRLPTRQVGRPQHHGDLCDPGPVPGNPQGQRPGRAPPGMYRKQNQSALDGLDALDLSKDDRSVLRTILQRNLAFMDECFAKGTYSYESFEQFIRGTTPHSVKTI